MKIIVENRKKKKVQNEKKKERRKIIKNRILEQKKIRGLRKIKGHTLVKRVPGE